MNKRGVADMNEAPVRVLMVEDNPSDALLIRYELSQSQGYCFEVTLVGRLAEAIGKLREEPFDVALLDLGLPDSNGVSTFTQIRTACPRLPIVVLTGAEDEAAGIEAIRHGVQDYLVKGSLDGKFIARAIRYAIERQRVEEALRERTTLLEERTRQLEDTIQELDGFSYSVSHDLKAPLRAVDGYARMILKKSGDKLDEDTVRMLDVIRSNTKLMGELIEDLLSFSRLSRKTVKVEKIDMGGLISDVWEEIRTANPDREMKVSITNILPGFGDPQLMRQVLANLLSNAVKFTRDRKPAVIEMSSCRRNGEVVYCLRDNGIGFDMRYHDKLFTVFERLNPEGYDGTGVGLAIVQRIIQRHGGRVWAEGETDRGATFFFTLPARNETVQE
jgi:signal transduction histidine kinase